MAVKIWDSVAGAFTDTATPKVWDSAAAYGDSTGLVYDAGAEAWEERWGSVPKPLYLYHEGYINTALTGGFEFGWFVSNNYFVPSGGVIRNNTTAKQLEIYVPSGVNHNRYGFITTKSPINLSRYSKLKVNYKCNYLSPPGSSLWNNIFLSVHELKQTVSFSSVFNNDPTVIKIEESNVLSGILELDISSVNTPKYIFFVQCGVYANKITYFYVDNIWLE